MRYFALALLSQSLLFVPRALSADIRPSCALAEKSIIGRTPTGLAQVSNLDSVEVTCRIPARRVPTKPGEGLDGLGVHTNAYEISPNGERKLVPSEVKVPGSGREGEAEWVEFLMLIPLDAKELDAEARRYYAKVLEALSPEQRAQVKADDEQKALENLRPMIAQSRVGHFRVECQVLDGDRVAGSDFIEMEVVFKGRISDLGLVSVPVAAMKPDNPTRSFVESRDQHGFAR